jgi:CheY-like chemotaxis protein
VGRWEKIVAKNLSTFAIAKMLHVDPGSVANWIDQNLLKAYRTPGGHRRVAAEDLVLFLREHNMPVPPELGEHPRRVLVVDDEPPITKLIARAIKDALPEVEVIEANDGFRAGSLAATLKPQVVILDLRMPGIDGFEVCKLIKGQEATRHAHVLAITAYPSEESEKTILECGAKACLTKPLEMSALVSHVKNLL